MKKLLATMSLGLALTMTACGGSPSVESPTPTAAPPEESTPIESVAVESTGPEASEDSHYPVTIVNYNYEGEEVEFTYEKAPEKVVAGYQGTIETMIALGLSDKVVASFGLDNPVKAEWEEGFNQVNYQAELRYPDKETMTMFEADMIFSWSSLFADDRSGATEGWNEGGVATFISSNTRRGGHARTLENEYNDILNLGTIFNVESEAQALVDEMKNEIEETLANVPEGETISVAIIEPTSSGTITNYGEASLAGDMVLALGGELAIPSSEDFGKEDLIAADPDVIFVVYMAYSGESPEEVMQTQLDTIKNDPALASLSVSESGKIFPIMLGDMYASGPRTMDGIKTISEGMYGN